MATLDGRLKTRSLDPSTWPDFARLVEANNGVWGGCWCLWYHGGGGECGEASSKRETKERLMREGRAHASLVYHGDVCVGWCQFGTPRDLPRIHNQRAYMATNPSLSDWRITCFFTGKGYRGRGVARVALHGAIEQIGKQGGGLVEGYPEDTANRSASSAFLFNGALSMFESLGFERQRSIGKHKWVVARVVSS